MRLSATRQASIAQSRGFGNLLWDLAGMPPLLDLRLAENKSLVNVVSGVNLATATRNSSGTFVGSDRLLQSAGVDIPRFTHDPVTGESLGLLPEGQRINLLTHSEDFTQWTLQNITGSGSLGTESVTRPNGVSTSYAITTGATVPGGTGDGVLRSGTVSNNQTITESIYLKAGTAVGDMRLRMRFTGGTTADGSVFLNLSTGTVLSASANRTGRIFPDVNGWYRATITGTNNATGNANCDFFVYASNTAAGTYYLDAAQMEEGSSATSYIKTEASTVTRSADVIDLINQAITNNIRTLYLEFRSPAIGTQGVVSLNDNTANERAAIITNGADPRLVVVDGGVVQADINGGSITAGARTRVAVRINENDFSMSINGGAPVTDTSGSLPSVDRIMLGRTQAGEHLNAPLARVIGWPNLVPDSLLQALSQ